MSGSEVTLENWTSYPHLRWGFLNTRELVPVADIGRGAGPVLEFEQDIQPLGDLPVGSATVDQILESGHTDGFIALHRGRVVTEQYRAGFTPDARHLLQSVSKSVAGSLAGILVAEGAFAVRDLVTDHVRELRGSSFAGATVRDVLDMRTGTAYSEDYDDPDSDVRITEELGGWHPARRRPYATVYEQIIRLANARPHGGDFEYRSILTDLLAWIMERATGVSYPDLVATRLWAPMGAERGAEITVREGIAMADGGLCATLRDVARFGLLHIGGSVVPEAWIQDIRRGRTYRNQWWVLDRDHLLARGIHGQLCWVDIPAEVVCVRLATHPAPTDERLRDLTLSAFAAIAAHCEASA